MVEKMETLAYSHIMGERVVAQRSVCSVSPSNHGSHVHWNQQLFLFPVVLFS